MFALFAVGSLFSLLGGSAAPNAAGSSAYAAGYMMGRIFFVLLCAAIASALWRSGNKRNPPRV